MSELACGSGSRLYILDEVIIWYWKIPSFESALCTRTSNGNVGHRGGSMSKGFTGSIWQPALGGYGEDALPIYCIQVFLLSGRALCE